MTGAAGIAESSSNWTRIASAAALALALDGCAMSSDSVEPLGPFGIVTHTTHYWTGYNEGNLHRAATEHYSINYRGKPFEFEGMPGADGKRARFKDVNAAITFGPQPAVVVDVGDPNNGSYFYLIREVDGAPRADPLGPDQGDVSAEWLDPPPEQAGAPKQAAIHRARMSGGHLLFVGRACVLDVDTFAIHRFHDPNRYALDPYTRPLALAPDRKSFVRFGSEGRGFILHVQNFIDDQAYVLALSRRRQRFAGREDVTAAWFDHYFAWQRGADGSDRLVERTDVAPLPLRGRRIRNEPGSAASYVLEPVVPAMRERLVEFLTERFGATRDPGRDGSRDQAYRANGQSLYLVFDGDSLDLFGENWREPKTDPALLDRIAAGFDAELASGKLDELLAE